MKSISSSGRIIGDKSGITTALRLFNRRAGFLVHQGFPCKMQTKSMDHCEEPSGNAAISRRCRYRRACRARIHACRRAVRFRCRLLFEIPTRFALGMTPGGFVCVGKAEFVWLLFYVVFGVFVGAGMTARPFLYNAVSGCECSQKCLSLRGAVRRQSNPCPLRAETSLLRSTDCFAALAMQLDGRY